MKRIFLMICLTLLFTVGAEAQPWGKTYKETIAAEEFEVRDSVFLQVLDSIVFRGGLSQIKDGVRRDFHVRCEPKKKDPETQVILMVLDDKVNLWENFRGCFTYNDYQFYWHGTVPDRLLKKTGKTRKLTTLRNLWMFDDSCSEYTFEYGRDTIKLTAVLCF